MLQAEYARHRPAAARPREQEDRRCVPAVAAVRAAQPAARASSLRRRRVRRGAQRERRRRGDRARARRHAAPLQARTGRTGTRSRAVCDPGRASWVGPSRHLRWENEVIVLGFGKHGGAAVHELAAGPDRSFLHVGDRRRTSRRTSARSARPRSSARATTSSRGRASATASPRRPRSRRSRASDACAQSAVAAERSRSAPRPAARSRRVARQEVAVRRPTRELALRELRAAERAIERDRAGAAREDQQEHEAVEHGELAAVLDRQELRACSSSGTGCTRRPSCPTRGTPPVA